MRLTGPRPVLACTSELCGATFDLMDSTLRTPDTDPDRTKGRTIPGANMVVRNDGRKRLEQARQAATEEFISKIDSAGAIPSDASSDELLDVVLFSQVKELRKKAFDRLLNAGCETQLRQIAEVHNTYSRAARAELDRKKPQY